MRNFALYIALGAVAFTTGLISEANSPQDESQPAKLAISTATVPQAQVGAAYSATIKATGGVLPYSFKALKLPTGLEINAATGAVHGTPAVGTRGTFNFEFIVTDSAKPTAQTAIKLLPLTIAPPKLAITTTTLPAGRVGIPYTALIVASGGVPPYSFSAPKLQTGLSINKATGGITGTPAVGTRGTFSFEFVVTDSAKPMGTAEAMLSLTIAPPGLVVETTALPGGQVNTAYVAGIAVEGGVKPYSFAASGLPTGLGINASTGQITGAPGAATAGPHTVAIRVTDATKPTALTGTANLPLGIAQAAGAEVCGGLNLGNNAGLNGFVPFPTANPWNTDISDAPLDSNNDAITSAAGFAGLHLHHDWSSVKGGNYGIPYVVVDSSATPSVAIDVIDYADESDIAVAPFPITAPIEGAPADCDGWPDNYIGDSHVLVLDRNRCMLYETFNTHRCKGAWNSSSETIWDMKNGEQRPWGWTSGDAAGLPIFPGLVRYDEVAAGAINHAIRFTMEHTKNDNNDGYFVEPGTHAAGTDWGVSNIMGMRIRLKANFDISGYSKANQVILTAMKKYGMILADNGGYFFFQGVPDSRWNDDDLVNLDSIQSSNFEVVQMTPGFPGWDSETAPTGAPPTIQSFTASATGVTAGTAVTLTWKTLNDSYDFIDKVGGVSGGSVTVNPTATTTYTLSSTNQYGRSTMAVTVKVQ